MTIELTEDTVVRAHELVAEHLAGLSSLVKELARHEIQIVRWGTELAVRLLDGQRLLVAGNGGSAAEAQHLTAELVGRFSTERKAFSALALSSETSSLTALGNDYGYENVFARQIDAHARPGDVVLLLSTSGASANLLRAVTAARRARAVTWALTGAAPNPLSELADESLALALPAPHVQEGHLMAVHALCCAFDAAVATWEAG